MAHQVESLEILKQSFILLYQTTKLCMTELCKQFDISGPPGYAILQRFETEGGALEDNSNRYKSRPWDTSITSKESLIPERNFHHLKGTRPLFSIGMVLELGAFIQEYVHTS